ncbi:ribonuclease P protein subunit p25 [Anastrepha obliqua]|uniref:ribonuclease P protein subunit p25 n=1 Tax=Anastrepha obliqua TaxID=95512 RepID=UPI00240A5A87|nr:ribonuclease P protein subunit p25 [Anastrepha obliqua]
MIHYRKGENIEQELTKEDLPFDDCLPKLPQKDFLWMHVRGGTKVHNVIDYAKNALDKGEYRTVVWSGSGGGVVKTVSCAEILKRSYPLNQLTRMDQITIEEHWLPQMDGLEPIVARRKVPSLHILMTLDEIDESITDVQKPNTTTEFWRGLSGSSQQQKQPRHAGQNNEGRGQQQQRHQRFKQQRQGKPPNQDRRPGQQEDGQAGEQQERAQRPQNRNRNRGEQRKARNKNNVDQEQAQQSHETPHEQPNDDGQQRQSQSQAHRPPKPKQKQQQQKTQQNRQKQSSEAMQVDVTPTSASAVASAASTSTAAEPMES